MTDFVIKRNDTSPALEFQLQDGSGSGVDISGYNNVRFLMVDGETSVIDDTVAGNVSVPDAVNGIVKYEWSSSDTEKEGFYDGEFEVEYSDGTVETFPNEDYIIVQIKRDLG